MKQQCALNKMSLNRNTYYISLCTDCTEDHRKLIWYFPQEQGSLITNLRFVTTLYSITIMYNENQLYIFQLNISMILPNFWVYMCIPHRYAHIHI